MSLTDYGRLIRAGLVLAREGAFSLIDPDRLEGLPRLGLRLIRMLERPEVKRTGRVERLSRALNRLGPTYVKFGQTLATRPDIVGTDIARDLSALQDRMDPFDPALVPDILKKTLGARAGDIVELSEPIAAASIAQVHKARIEDKAGNARTVAIKVLRPGVEKRFSADLRSFYAGARLGERMVPALRRLKPVEVVETLDHSARMELDLSFEAAAISKFSENAARSGGFGAPLVEWDYVGKKILTTSWIDAIPVRDHDALDAAGVDRKVLAAHLLQGFLTQAIGDGFFHADMHPGNLFADPATSRIVAVDFGIVGNLGFAERNFLAEMLYGFITRDYDLIARRHFEIGYVPKGQSMADFALAIRAIGEPLNGRTAEEISIARMLTQLFEVTDVFDMATRPELLLLQKTMVMAEGVARSIDPGLDIWAVARPVLEPFVRRQKGPAGRYELLWRHAETGVETLGMLPGLVTRADRVLAGLERDMAGTRGGTGWLWAAGIALLAGLVLGLLL